MRNSQSATFKQLLIHMSLHGCQSSLSYQKVICIQHIYHMLLQNKDRLLVQQVPYRNFKPRGITAHILIITLVPTTRIL